MAIRGPDIFGEAIHLSKTGQYLEKGSRLILETSDDRLLVRVSVLVLKGLRYNPHLQLSI